MSKLSVILICLGAALVVLLAYAASKPDELALEAVGFEPAKVYQQALYAANMPITAFVTSDVDAEAQNLRDRGVTVRGEAVNLGPIKAVMFEDGCGNLIHLVQPLIKPE